MSVNPELFEGGYRMTELATIGRRCDEPDVGYRRLQHPFNRDYQCVDGRGLRDLCHNDK